MLKHVLAVALLSLAVAGPAPAAGLDSPKGEVVLSLTGHIQNKNDGNQASFDLAMLEALTGRSATMETPWTKGATRFDGPFLREVLLAAGAHGKKLRVKAINDYSAEVPVEDATGLDTILAVKMNGASMSVRDKGPLFLIYPFDKNPELYNEKYFSRSVWQIKEIEVID